MWHSALQQYPHPNIALSTNQPCSIAPDSAALDKYRLIDGYVLAATQCGPRRVLRIRVYSTNFQKKLFCSGPELVCVCRFFLPRVCQRTAQDEEMRLREVAEAERDQMMKARQQKLLEGQQVSTCGAFLLSDRRAY